MVDDMAPDCQAKVFSNLKLRKNYVELVLNKHAFLKIPGDTLSGELGFKLYDTYGFLDLLKERRINFDRKERKSWIGSGEKSVKQTWFDLIDKFDKTEFIGYESNEAKDAKKERGSIKKDITERARPLHKTEIIKSQKMKGNKMEHFKKVLGKIKITLMKPKREDLFAGIPSELSFLYHFFLNYQILNRGITRCQQLMLHLLKFWSVEKEKKF
ncbi:hypothetical protein X798_04414 [Onchocerca flexuosa]|uniref:Uncharacterized protein n=1 Tax=Onchocerca flexuosa TaxID=387005 RepID=A0A238BV87_9BILA|nr:hypothetical protein X798_04414 [Onchocerca flexuosa]